MVVGPSAAAASTNGVGAARGRISRVEQRIISQGDAVEQLVGRADQAQSRLAAEDAQMAADQRRLQAAGAAEEAAAARLRQVAIYMYINGSALPSGRLPSMPDAAEAAIQAEYATIATGNLSQALDSYRLDQRVVHSATVAVRGAAARTSRSVALLAADRQQAQTALAADEATLSRDKNNLAQLLAAVRARQAAQQRERELALAARPVAAVVRATDVGSPRPPPTTTSTSAPSQPSPVLPALPSPSPQPSPSGGAPSGYSNPLRAINALSPERIDQGVDYSGYGPIYPMGDGVVLSTTNAGWPGGTFIAYRLTDGRASGLVVYAAEDIEPQVSVGQRVTPDTQLGTMYEGRDGIETGWADSSGGGNTMAGDAGQFNGSNSTAFGYNFSQLLQSVGAPGGVLQNDPPTGSLPPGWPQW